MNKLTVLFVTLFFLTGCANCGPSGPEGSVSPGPTVIATMEPTTAPTPTVMPQATPTPDEGADRSHITTPVLIGGFLVGGLIQGEWEYYDTFYKSKAVDLDGYVYDVYVDDEYVGEATGGLPLSYLTGEPLMPEDDLSDLADVKLYNEDRQKIEYDIALQGDWDLYPRQYVSQSTDQEEYLSAAKALLAEKGLTDPVTALKQVIEVDLDGDGTMEVLFAADNMTGEKFGNTKKGDNALLVMRRITDGQAADRIIDSFIVKKEPDYTTMYRLLYEVATCADLDGDGILEVVVRGWHYEGEIWNIYKLAGDRLRLVAAKGAGL